MTNDARGTVLLTHVTLLAWLASSCVVHAAPPTLKSLYPPAASLGESATVEADGTFAAWPVTVLVDRPGVEVQPAEKKGQLQVTVAGDAQPGIYRIRVADDQGVSAARPFLVGTLPGVVEKEPNNANDQAQVVEPAVHVSGKLQSGGDVDAFRVTLKRGQTLLAAVEANQVLGAPMDAVLQVCTPAGFVLRQNDDERGIDPLIAFAVPEDGEYLVRIFAFPETANSSIAFAGGADFAYRLTLTTGGWLDYALPMAIASASPAPDAASPDAASPDAASPDAASPDAAAPDAAAPDAASPDAGAAAPDAAPPEAPAAQPPLQVRVGGENIPETLGNLPVASIPGDPESVAVFHSELAGFFRLPVVGGPSLVAEGGSREQPQAIPIPATVSGRLDDRSPVHAFRFTAEKAQPLRIAAESYRLGFPLDPLLQVIDDSDKVLSEVDDVSGERDASLLFRPPADGSYRLVLRDLHGRVGPRFVYRLTLEPAVADYQLTVEADAFNVEVGKPLEVTVKVERRDGYAKPIEISAVDLPEGVTAEPATSEPKGDSAKQVKLKLSADKAFTAHKFRIRGRGADEDREVQARFAIPSLNRTTPELWLAGFSSP